jgi:hypothetical protein
VLVSGWERLPPFERTTYPAMVAAMERAGIHTEGKPPVWAWGGVPTLLDVRSLFDPEYQLSAGYAVVEFDAPTEVVFLSDYGDWNDHLEGWFEDPEASWEPGPLVRSVGLPQACVPCVRVEWVREIRVLPTTGWDNPDLLEHPA